VKVPSWTAETLLSGSEEETCPRMELVQETDDGPRVIRGPGYLKGGPDGQIRFKIFTPELEGPSDALGFRETVEPGTIVPPHHFYRLSAVDRFGDTWTAGWILPSQHYSSVVGDLAEIRCTTGFPDREAAGPLDPANLEAGGITLWFDGRLDLQFNAATLTSSRIDTFGRPHARLEDDLDLPSFSRNVIRFSSCGCDFDIVQEADHYSLTVRSMSPFPPYFPTRVVESLQFMLGKIESWRASEIMSGGRREIVVRSSGDDLKAARFQPPLLPRHHVEADSESAHPLFDRYLRFLIGFAGPCWHPCSIHLHHAITSSASSVGAYTLGLGVAVEGICELLFEGLARPTADETILLQQLLEHVESWPAATDHDEARRWVAERLRSRARGSLSNLGRSRALDRLNRLVELGAVERRLVEAWKKLRNTAAHARLPDPGEARQNHDWRSSACVLLHQVIFYKIG
jgi:hypothetical protein